MPVALLHLHHLPPWCVLLHKLVVARAVNATGGTGGGGARSGAAAGSPEEATLPTRQADGVGRLHPMEIRPPMPRIWAPVHATAWRPPEQAAMLGGGSRAVIGGGTAWGRRRAARASPKFSFLLHSPKQSFTRIRRTSCLRRSNR
ncbi:hypothetical protein BS78_K024100 [Paspalum vaginatum]|uniref:Secreted protein n=1 Tax=Paspalum vaginatum TaxID=158149 RepID=A0A9W7XCK5_9POAL|nr:hypothetical protein BS78_K024100 [Paspalum vaginatum]